MNAGLGSGASAPRFHAWFAPYVPVLDGASGGGAVFSLKFERHKMGFEYAFADIVTSSPERVTAIPFIVVSEQGLVFPRACRALAPAFLTALTRAIAERLNGGAAAWASLQIAGSDPDLRRLAQSPCGPGDPVAPGLAPHERLFDVVARYQHAAARAAGRSVLDLNPLLGFGTRTLRGVAAKIRACPPSVDAAAARLGLWPLEREHGERCFGLVIALDCPPGRIDAVLEQARRAVAPGGQILISARGEAGAQALRRHGEPHMMFRPALEAAGPMGEYQLWIEPPAAAIAMPDLERVPALAGPRPLRVLFALRPSAETTFGGDVVQVQRTAQALRERGHEVAVSTHAAPAASGYDVVHLTNSTAGPEGVVQAQAVRGFPGPVVLMPIFIDHSDETVWGMQTAPTLFYGSVAEDDLAARLAQLAARDITANNVPPPPARPEMYDRYTAMQREILSCVDFIVANAYSEVHRIYRYLEPDIPFALAPSAADAQTYGPHARAAFVAKYGLEDFILTTGRIEPRKNQLLLLWATRAMPERRLVVIGKNFDPFYGFFSQVYARENVVFLPQMPEHELAGAYAAARVFALPSWDEVVSLSALNAALSGPSLVLTRNGYEHEYFRDDARYCDPADSASIAAAIEAAWTAHDELTERRAALRERVRREYTWERAAELTEAAYYRVLAHNPRGRRRRSADNREA